MAGQKTRIIPNQIIKVARILDDRTATRIPKEASLTRSTYCLIENGRVIPKPEELKRIKRVLPNIEDFEADGIFIPGNRTED